MKNDFNRRKKKSWLSLSAFSVLCTKMPVLRFPFRPADEDKRLYARALVREIRHTARQRETGRFLLSFRRRDAVCHAGGQSFCRYEGGARYFHVEKDAEITN